MAEVGLVTFARVALCVGQAGLPAYRSKFSKHRFRQPQLLAVLCLIRYEAWTFREPDVRLAEHSELRAALGLQHVPDYTTLYRFLRRLNEAVLEQILSAVIQWLVPQPDRYTTVAVDATGLAPGAISTFFVKRAKDRGEGFTWRHWLKWCAPQKFHAHMLDVASSSSDNMQEQQCASQRDAFAMTRYPNLLRNVVLLVHTLLILLMDAWRFLRLCLRPSPVLAAGNLFLRKQLALYQERQIKPHRSTQATRMALDWLAR